MKSVGKNAQKFGLENHKWWWRRTNQIDRQCLESIVKQSHCIANVALCKFGIDLVVILLNWRLSKKLIFFRREPSSARQSVRIVQMDVYFLQECSCKCNFICNSTETNIFPSFISELYLNAYHKRCYLWCGKGFLFSTIDYSE